MRPTLALVLLVVLLAVGGTLYLVLGRGEAPPAVEPTASVAQSAPAAQGPDAVTAPTAEATPAPGAERTSIAAAPKSEPSAAKASGTSLVGRLLDSSGAPVVGAAVRANRGEFDIPEFEDTRIAIDGSQKTTSDAAGRFELRGLKPGSAHLSVRAPGFVPLSKPGIGIPDAPRHDVGDLALETSVVLEGRVVDSRGIGVAGARLTRAGAAGFVAFDLSGDLNQGPPPLAVTAADGSFRIDQLASGPWRVRIASEEHPDKLESGTTQRPGERLAGLAFALEDGFEIAGRVSGVPPASVDGVTVVAAPPSTQGEVVIMGLDEAGVGENRRRAKLANDGTFVVKGLRQGNYQLQARVKGSGPDAFWPRSASERVEAKSGDRGVLIAWQPASVLAFQVVDAVSKAPVELLDVSARTRGSLGFVAPGMGRAKRYAEGKVRLDDLRPRDANDRATLTLEAPGYQSQELKDIALTRGIETDLGVIELQRSTTVDVRVVDARTRGGLEKARVELSVVEEGAPEGGGAFRARRAIAINDEHGDITVEGGSTTTARTDADGLARLNSTPGRKGRVTVTKDGYAPYTSEPFEMPEGANVDHLVTLDQGGSVEITLLSAEGTPVSGARIEHRAPDAGDDPFGGSFGRGKGAATDANGKVTIANLAPGLHRFRPAKSDGGMEFGEGMVFSFDGQEVSGEGWGEVQVVRGEIAALELREPERAEVFGRLREGGVSLAGASLTLKKRGGDPRFEGLDDLPFGGGGARAKSDGEGRYRFERVEAGSYDLVVRHATRAMAARFPVEVDASGLEYDVDLPVSILEGRVVDTENKPVAGAKVWVEKQRPEGGVRAMRAISIMADSSEGGMVFDSSASMDGSRAKTDEDGRYSLRGVESDVDLEVHVDARDCEPAKSAAVQVALGQTRGGVDVEVAPAGAIKVKVVGAPGQTPGPCLVQAEYVDPQPEGSRVEPKTEFAQGGSVTLKGLRPGRWKLAVEGLDGFGPGQQNRRGEPREVVVVARETVPIELQAP